MKTQIPRIVFVLSCVMSAALAEQPSGWWWRGGAVFRGGATYELEGTSTMQTEGRSAAAIGVRSPGADVGSASSPANRIYDNGFVRVDPATANSPGLVTPNLTTHWGYQSNSQLSGRNLTFSRTGPQGLIRTDIETRSLGEDKSVFAPGIELAAGKPFRLREDSRWDWVGGIRVFALGKNTVSGVPQVEQYRGQIVRITDTYRLDDIQTTEGTVTPSPPPAPYSGSPGSTVVKNAIPNIPASRSVRILAAGDWRAETRVRADVDAMQYELRLGAQWSRALGGKTSLSLQPSLSMNMLDVDVKRQENVVAVYADGNRETLYSFSDQESSTEFLFGAGIQFGVAWALSELWDLELSAGYDYVEEASVKVGPNTVNLDLSGYTVGLSVRRGFGGRN